MCYSVPKLEGCRDTITIDTEYMKHSMDKFAMHYSENATKYL